VIREIKTKKIKIKLKITMTRFALATTLSNFHAQTRNNIRVALLPEVSRKTMLLLIAAVSVVGILYIWQINSMATLGYQVKDLETQKSDLLKTNTDLSLQITDKTSSEYVMSRLQELNMIPVGSISYLKVPGSVALNK